jgi:acetyl esterase/lipase
MKSYDIHKDLRFLKPFKFQYYSPLRLKFANAALRVMSYLTVPNMDVKFRTYRYQGHNNGMVRITLYRLKIQKIKPKGAIVFYHGGGFQMTGTPVHIRLASNLVAETGYLVYYVHYRIAPEYPFPYALEDSYQGLLFAHAHATWINPDLEEFMVYGDSAGGNLAAAMTLLAKDRKGPKITKQILIYPVTSHKLDTPSMIEYTNTPMWNANLNKAMWENYLIKGDFGMFNYISILEADLHDLPKCYIETAEFDCLRDQGILYDQKLRASGVDVTSFHTYQTVHGYDGVFFSPFVKTLVERRTQFIMGVENII